MTISRTSTRSTRVTRAAIAAGGALALATLTGAPAQAHDVLLSASPEADSIVESTPEEVRLTFSGNLTSGQGIQNLVQVSDEDGNQWQDGEAEVAGTDLSTALCEGMPNGDYEVAYRVVYSDGHSEEHEYGFTLDDPAAPDSGVPTDGCGVAVAAAGPTTAPTEAATAPEDSGATEGAATAAPAEGEAAADDAAETTAQTGEAPGQSLPGWVWAVGLGGAAVVIAALVLMFRKAKSLNG